jgi:hypothetical protein
MAHLAAVALHVAFYNLCRVHEALRSTPPFGPMENLFLGIAKAELRLITCKRGQFTTHFVPLGGDMKSMATTLLFAATAVFVIVAGLMAVADIAKAQSSGRGGANPRPIMYCPTGTCSPTGRRGVYNLANCKASNCK